MRRPSTGHPGQGRKGDRLAIVVRLATLMRLVAACRWLPPVPQLARELEVHPNTVKRDLVALEAAGWIHPREGETRAHALVTALGGGLR